ARRSRFFVRAVLVAPPLSRPGRSAGPAAVHSRPGLLAAPESGRVRKCYSTGQPSPAKAGISMASSALAAESRFRRDAVAAVADRPSPIAVGRWDGGGARRRTGGG